MGIGNPFGIVTFFAFLDLRGTNDTELLSQTVKNNLFFVIEEFLTSKKKLRISSGINTTSKQGNGIYYRK